MRYQEYGLSLVSRHPLLGTLPGRFVHLVRHEGVRHIPGSVHSLYIGTALDYGLPMVAILSFVLMYSFFSGKRALKDYKKELSSKKNFYLKLLLGTSTSYTISIMIHGLTENFDHYFIFLNLGYIAAAKNVLIRQRKSVSFAWYRN